MIGLQRGTVHLSPCDSAWADDFEKEKKLLLDAFGDKVLAIEHVGSTAVPGLSAKPIIDIEIGLRKLNDYKMLIPLAEKLGYQFMPDRVFEDYVFMPKGSENCRTHYLHFATIDSDEWRNILRFRDLLRSDSILRDGYASLKAKLAAQNSQDRESYTTAKTDFIRKSLEECRDTV